MPIYEYFCLSCGKLCDHLVLDQYKFTPYCKHCGSKSVKKLISRVRVRLSMDTRIERLADPTFLGALDEEDPRSMMKLMRHIGKEFSEELGDDFDELMETTREEIEEFSKKNTEKETKKGVDIA